MGLIRKSLSISSGGVINYRNKSERAAAAERKKAKNYKDRTRIDADLRERELALREREVAVQEAELAQRAQQL